MNGFALRLKGRRPLLFAALLTACALLCLALFAGRAFADAETPTIAYDGAARQLTVQGAQGSATATDLFPAFKNLMPGDKRQQDVDVRASGVDSEVSVYATVVVDDERRFRNHRAHHACSFRWRFCGGGASKPFDANGR